MVFVFAFKMDFKLFGIYASKLLLELFLMTSALLLITYYFDWDKAIEEAKLRNLELLETSTAEDD